MTPEEILKIDSFLDARSTMKQRNRKEIENEINENKEFL